MNILQQLNISPGTAALIAAGLCVLCLVLPVVLSGLNVITTIVTTFTHLISSGLHVVSGGPVAWCGCLMAIAGCGLIVMVVWFLANAPASCAAHPTNFCGLLGYH